MKKVHTIAKLQDTKNVRSRTNNCIGLAVPRCYLKGRGMCEHESPPAKVALGTFATKGMEPLPGAWVATTHLSKRL